MATMGHGAQQVNRAGRAGRGSGGWRAQVRGAFQGACLALVGSCGEVGCALDLRPVQVAAAADVHAVQQHRLLQATGRPSLSKASKEAVTWQQSCLLLLQ